MAKNRKYNFAIEFVASNNATQAAIKAGYSPKTAYSSGHRLAHDPEVVAIIQKEREKLSDKTKVTYEKIISDLDRVLDLAIQLEKPSAAVSAIVAKAKLAGLFDKENGDFDDSPVEVKIHK